MTFEGFMKTEIGFLPDDWNIETIGSIAGVSSGGSAPQGDKYFKGSHPFVRVQHIELESDVISRWDLITDEAVKTYKLKLFPKHTILFPKSGASIYLEKRAMLPLDAYIVSHLCAINSDNPQVWHKYLFFSLKSIKFSKDKADGYPTLNLSEIRSFEIPLPPFPEQQKIAAVLSAVQEAKEKTEGVIKATKELKKSMMKHLFTYGAEPIEEAEKVPLKETEIGLIPEHWEVVRLENAVIKTKQKNPEKYPEWQFKYIDVSGVNREMLTISDYQLHLGKDAPSRAKKLVQTGDVIFATVRPTLKRVALIDDRFDGQICSTAFCILRANENTIPYYIYYAVTRDSFIYELGKIQRGASYPAVTDSDVKNQNIPLPPLHEQQQIAETLSAIDDKIHAEQTKKNALESLFKTLLSLLMTGKIRVKDLEI